MTEKRVKRKLSAILSADVAGYSRLMGEDEVSTVRTLEAYRAVMSDLIEQFRGRVVDSPGDNLLAEFSSVVDAVQCAVEIHDVIRAKNEELPQDRRMLFRIGVNLGDVIQEGDRIYGDGVNIAARLEGLAEAGGICISGSAHEQIENKLALGYEYLGEHTVKNIAKPVKVYKVPMGPKAVIPEEKKEKKTKLKKQSTSLVAKESTGTVTRMMGAVLRQIISWIAIIILVAVIGGLIIGGMEIWMSKGGMDIWMSKPKEPRQVIRFCYELPEGQQLINFTNPILAVSPNGRQFAFCTSKGLCLRSLDELDVRLISSAAESPSNPFFSPDGQCVGYFSNANFKMKKVAISGGTPVVLLDAGAFPFLGASWDLDSTIVYSEGGKGIMRVSANGGTPETLIAEEKETFYHPRLLPGGKSVLFTLGTNEGYKIAVQSLESGERKVLFKGDCAWYLPTGHIIFTLENNIFAIPFHPNTLQTAGEQVPMVEGVFRAGPMYAPQYAISISGTLVYVPIEVAASSQSRILVWVDRNGKEEPLGAPPDTYRNPKISPDGTRVALTVDTDSKSDIWIWNFDQETMTRLTFNEGSAYPLWTLDGKRIAFSLTRSGMMLGDVYWKAADGTGEEEKLGTAPGRSLYPCSWSSDGKTLVLMDQASYNEQGPGLGSHIGALSIEGDRKWRRMLQEKFYEAYPQVSPNGRWMAYKSGESYVEAEVYVRPFPEMDSGKWQVSMGGGEEPLWSPDGRELFYRNGNSVIAVDVQTEPTFKIGKPKILFQRAYFSRRFHFWDLSPDGKRFLMIKLPAVTDEESASKIQRKINVVLNWFEELKERVPVD